MMTFVYVFLVAVLFGAVYILMHIVHQDKPKCPRCDHRMTYKGEDESDREIWVCEECGEVLML